MKHTDITTPNEHDTKNIDIHHNNFDIFYKIPIDEMNRVNFEDNNHLSKGQYYYLDNENVMHPYYPDNDHVHSSTRPSSFNLKDTK